MCVCAYLRKLNGSRVHIYESALLFRTQNIKHKLILGRTFYSHI